MPLSVRGRADTIATFRFVAVHLMETLARWVPSSPELEVKILFGRHLWFLAQHADAFGQRTGELRVAAQTSRAPLTAFKKALDDLAAVQPTAERVDGFYLAVVPRFEAMLKQYLDEADPIMDDPTIQILRRVLMEMEQMRTERDELRSEWPDLALDNNPWIERIAATTQHYTDIVDFRPAPPVASE